MYFKNPQKAFSLALTAAGGVQHRGQQGAGVAIKTEKDLIVTRSDGLLRQIFPSPVIPSFDSLSKWILIHCRYGTSGDYDERNLQPCIAKDKDLTAALVHNGEFTSIDNLKKKLSFTLPEGISDTYVFTKLFENSLGKTWEEKLVNSFKEAKGSFSLIIGAGNEMFVARDNFGIRPLIFGEIENGFIFASETHALDKINAKIKREISPGEILKVTKTGPVMIKKGINDKRHFCDFEWAYFSRPDSLANTNEKKSQGRKVNSWLSFSDFRNRCGKILAKESPINADFVIGIPDSGIQIATGYARALKIPYQQYIIRDHYDENGLSRLFMRDDQKKLIGQKVLGKLSLVPDLKIWKNKIVILADDSIVRGNVSREITKAVLAIGAKEVHWLIGFPPVAFTCHLGVSIRTKEELIACNCQNNPEKIAKEIGATSVNYISNAGFVKARSIFVKPKKTADEKVFLENNGCGGCVTGIYPVNKI